MIGHRRERLASRFIICGTFAVQIANTFLPWLFFPDVTNAVQHSRTSTPTSLRSSLTVKVKSEVDVVMSERNGTSDEQPVNMSAVTKTEDRGHPERKRRASDESLDVS